MAQSAGDAAREADVLAAIAEMARESRDYATSTSAYNEAILLWRDLGDQATIARALASIGQNYADQDSAEQALSFYRQAAQVADQAKDSSYAATVLDGIARYLDTLDQPTEAQAAFAEAAAQWRSIDAAKAVTSLLSAGQISSRVKDYASAADYAASALEIAESSRNAEAQRQQPYCVWRCQLAAECTGYWMGKLRAIAGDRPAEW